VRARVSGWRSNRRAARRLVGDTGSNMQERALEDPHVHVFRIRHLQTRATAPSRQISCSRTLQF